MRTRWTAGGEYGVASNSTEWQRRGHGWTKIPPQCHRGQLVRRLRPCASRSETHFDCELAASKSIARSGRTLIRYTAEADHEWTSSYQALLASVSFCPSGSELPYCPVPAARRGVALTLLALPIHLRVIDAEDARVFHTAASARGPMTKASSRRQLRASARIAHSGTHSSAWTQKRIAGSVGQTRIKTPCGAYGGSDVATRSPIVLVPSGKRHRRHDAPCGPPLRRTSRSRRLPGLCADTVAPTARSTPARELIRRAQRAAEGETCLLGRRRLAMDVILDGRPVRSESVDDNLMEAYGCAGAESQWSKQRTYYPLRDLNGGHDGWDRWTYMPNEIPVQDLHLHPGKRFQVSAERTTASWDGCVTVIVEGEATQTQANAGVGVALAHCAAAQNLAEHFANLGA